MANVELPQIGINNTHIDEAGMDGLKEYVKSLLNTTVMLTEELTYLLNNLDTRNVNELNAEIIIANTITADKMNVNELSAITANLGHIISGLIESVEIYGSYIATRNGSYPRAEMSSNNNLFGAFNNASNSIQIEADYAGAPTLVFYNGGSVRARLSTLLGTLLIDAINGMEINVTGGGYLTIPSFSRVVSSSGSNLGVELDRKATAGISTGSSGGHNHGIPDGTQLMTADGGTVTFFSAPQHTHSQSS